MSNYGVKILVNKYKSDKWSYAILLTLFSIALFYSTCSMAGGIALGATRVIYPQGEKQVSLPVTNSNAKNSFLIQSWVANADGSKSSDFVITPPLFVISPKKENILRIMYVGPNLPGDRESVYYLNSKAIPSVNKNKTTGNTLQIATQSVIKLFVRPKELPTPSVDAPRTLHCTLSGNTVTITNPSPYYVSLVQFYVNNRKLPNTMIPPKDSRSVTIIPGGNGAITFQTINDFGANTPKQTCGS